MNRVKCTLWQTVLCPSRIGLLIKNDYMKIAAWVILDPFISHEVSQGPHHAPTSPCKRGTTKARSLHGGIMRQLQTCQTVGAGWAAAAAGPLAAAGWQARGPEPGEPAAEPAAAGAHSAECSCGCRAGNCCAQAGPSVPTDACRKQ